ncbi:MAG: DUF4112 domain-containing protein [Clostridiales bacterium]|nr:DUF4112 domain-containing protein [Candidatus Crickella caballi]
MGRIFSKKAIQYKLEALTLKYKAKVMEFINDDEKIEHFLQGCEEILYLVPVVGDLASEIPTVISMLRAHFKKEYTGASNAGIIWIMAGMLYFLAPVDFVPDAIPGIGKVDDVAILAYVLKKVEPDLEKYKEWQKVNCLR